MERKVIQTGDKNDFTFRENIEENSQGKIIKSIEIDGRKMHQVEFANCIIATIDDGELSIPRLKY